MVLDTHMYIWLCLGTKPVPPEVLAELSREASAAVLSAASIWEITMLLEKGRLSVRGEPNSTIGAWRRRYPVPIIPIDSEIALLSRTLPFAHEDPADRFIAATAHKLGVPLATSDARLLSLPWLRTLP